MENLLTGWNQVKSGSEKFNYPKLNVPMVDTSDIGRSAAACLAAPNIDEHDQKKYSMNGPELLTGEDIARYMSKALDRDVQYNQLPKEVYHKFMPLGLAQIMDYFGEMGEQAAPFTDDVKMLTGRNNSLSDFLKCQL